MSSSVRRRRVSGGAAVVAVLIGLLAVIAAPTTANAAIGSACSGANSQPDAFPDAGLAANCLKAYGIAKGKPNGTFGEQDNLKRQQFGGFATRFLTAANIPHTAREPFSDVDENSVPDAELRQDIEEGHAAGVVNGFSDGTFKPLNDMSVSQAATIVLNLGQAIHTANSSAPNIAPVNDPSTGKPDSSKSYDAAVQQGILDLNAKAKDGTKYPNGKTDVTQRGLFADMLAELLQKEVDAGIIANAFVVTEAPQGTSSPTIRKVDATNDAFTSTNSLQYFYDSNDTFQLKGASLGTGSTGLNKFEGLLNPDDVLSVTYDPNANGVSVFNIISDVVHAPGQPSAQPVGPVTNGPPPGLEMQDVIVSVNLPTDNNSAVIYKLQRAQTPCISPQPGPFSDVTTAGDDISDGRQTDKAVPQGCYLYRVTAASNGDAGATTVNSSNSSQVTVPSSDSEAPTIKDVHVEADANGVADGGDKQVFTFSETMDSSLGAAGTTYRLSDGDGTQVDIVCGTNATCTLDNNGFDPGPPPSSFGTLTVTLTAAPTVVSPGTTAGLQYGASGAVIVSVDSHFKDQAGNALDLNGSDRQIERKTA